uniref:Transmembrane protein n=1 Tax=Anopheles culicifacies TaxID=139723 RepID=A0A182MNX2_9DIPT
MIRSERHRSAVCAATFSGVTENHDSRSSRIPESKSENRENRLYQYFSRDLSFAISAGRLATNLVLRFFFFSFFVLVDMAHPLSLDATAGVSTTVSGPSPLSSESTSFPIASGSWFNSRIVLDRTLARPSVPGLVSSSSEEVCRSSASGAAESVLSVPLAICSSFPSSSKSAPLSLECRPDVTILRTVELPVVMPAATFWDAPPEAYSTCSCSSVLQ